MSEDRPWQKWNDDAIVANLKQDWDAESRKTQRTVLAFEVDDMTVLARNPEMRVVKLLEVGCGLGHDFEAVALPRIGRSMAAPLLYGGVDVTPKMVEACKTRFPGHAHRFAVGDVYDLAFGDRFFDIVYSADVLIHLPDWNKALDELARVCRGTIVLKLAYVVEGETRVVKKQDGFMDVWFNVHWVVRALHERGFPSILVHAVTPEESRDRSADLRQVFVARRATR